MGLLGAGLIFFSTYLYSLESTNLFLQFLQVLFEPAGWFTAWTGLDEIYYNVKQKEPDLKFYEKMYKSEIKFVEYNPKEELN
jgi:hypothetical protein